MFDFNEANKMLDIDETELCLTSPEVKKNYLEIESIQTAEQAAQKLRASIDIMPLVKMAEGYEIYTVEGATEALSMALQARKLATAMIESKKEITRPQLDFQKAINKLAGDYIEKLTAIEKRLTVKLEQWIEESTDSAYSSGLDAIQVTDGSLKRVNTWCFEVENSPDIPIEYRCVDREGIEKAIKSGIRHIPGVKIFQKQEIKLRVKN